MIGRYLLTLTTEQETRILTRRMAPGPDWVARDGVGCLVATACAYRRLPWWHFDRLFCGCIAGNDKVETQEHDDMTSDVGMAYDNACYRFTTERVNAAIRNRILTNIARRELAGVREAVPA